MKVKFLKAWEKPGGRKIEKGKTAYLTNDLAKNLEKEGFVSILPEGLALAPKKPATKKKVTRKKEG